MPQGLGIDNNTSKAILNLQSFSGINTVILQAGNKKISAIYCDYVIRLYKIENRYFLQVWSWPCCYHITSIYHAKFGNILYDIFEKMVIWVAVLPRVDQLTKWCQTFGGRCILPSEWLWNNHKPCKFSDPFNLVSKQYTYAYIFWYVVYFFCFRLCQSLEKNGLPHAHWILRIDLAIIIDYKIQSIDQYFMTYVWQMATFQMICGQ